MTVRKRRNPKKVTSPTKISWPPSNGCRKHGPHRSVDTGERHARLRPPRPGRGDPWRGDGWPKPFFPSFWTQRSQQGRSSPCTPLPDWTRRNETSPGTTHFPQKRPFFRMFTSAPSALGSPEREDLPSPTAVPTGMDVIPPTGNNHATGKQCQSHQDDQGLPAVSIKSPNVLKHKCPPPTVRFSTSTTRYPPPWPVRTCRRTLQQKGGSGGPSPACRTGLPNPVTLRNGDDSPGKLTVSPTAGSRETSPAPSHR